MPANDKNQQLRMWSLEETEAFLQWLETNKLKVRKTKISKLCQDVKSEVELLRENEQMSPARINDKFYNMRKQYLATKKTLNSSGHGVQRGTIDGKLWDLSFLSLRKRCVMQFSNV